MRRFGAVMILGLMLLSCGAKKQAPPESELFAQAAKLESQAEYAKEVETYQLIVDNYPDSPNCYKALFMIGYIQLEHLKNPRKSAAALEILLKKYPDCDLAENAAHIRAVALSGRDLLQAFNDSLKTD